MFAVSLAVGNCFAFIFCLSKSEVIERIFLHKYVVKCVDNPGISVISSTCVYVLFNL